MNIQQQKKRKPIWRLSKNLFAQLLLIWGGYRRMLMVALLTAVLAGLMSSLPLAIRQTLLKSLMAQRGLITLLLIFILLTLSLLWSAGQRLDTWIFLLLNLRGHHPLWLDRVMWGLTQIGNGAVGILLGIFLYYGGEKRLALELLLGILTLWLSVEFVKAFVERARPFLALEGTRVIGWREWGKSFPSGHTSQAFFMMTLLIYHYQPNFAISSLLYGTAILVGFTRIYVGAHYPRDVIGGAILGNVWGIFSRLVEMYLSTGKF